MSYLSILVILKQNFGKGHYLWCFSNQHRHTPKLKNQINEHLYFVWFRIAVHPKRIYAERFFSIIIDMQGPFRIEFCYLIETLSELHHNIFNSIFDVLLYDIQSRNRLTTSCTGHYDTIPCSYSLFPSIPQVLFYRNLIDTVIKERSFFITCESRIINIQAKCRM